MFEAEITPGMSTAEVVALGRLAEEVGFDRLGVSDVVFWPDCFVLLGLLAQGTSQIGLGPMVTNPYSRHPAVLAGAMAALQDASDGRAFLGIGVRCRVGAARHDVRTPGARPARSDRRDHCTVAR